MEVSSITVLCLIFLCRSRYPRVLYLRSPQVVAYIVSGVLNNGGWIELLHDACQPNHHYSKGIPYHISQLIRSRWLWTFRATWFLRPT